MKTNYMKHIYKKAEELGIKIYPYRKNRLDKTNSKHIIPDVNNMNDKDFKDYFEALYNVQNENANGWDGWATAHKIFERLFFVKKEIQRGHRCFVSYSYNPIK